MDKAIIYARLSREDEDKIDGEKTERKWEKKILHTT